MSLRKTAITEKEVSDRSNEEKYQEEFLGECGRGQILMLLSVILTCLPLVIPRLLGSEAFGIVSGSMEPNIPIGSLIFTEPVDPNDVLEGEVIAFQSGDAVVAHRVMRNAIDEQAFVTKGDANPAIDFNSVPYSELIGRVSFHIPYIGRVLMLYASPAGKISAAAVAVSGLIFTVLGGMLDRKSVV